MSEIMGDEYTIVCTYHEFFWEAWASNGVLDYHSKSQSHNGPRKAADEVFDLLREECGCGATMRRVSFKKYIVKMEAA